MTPTLSRVRPSRATGTVHTKPFGATSRPTWISTTSARQRVDPPLCAVWIA